MSTIHPQPSTAEVFGCDELPCVNVGVGIMHHPYCGERRDDPEMGYGPDSPEDEEMRPPDPLFARCRLALCGVRCSCAGRNPSHPFEVVP